MKAISLSMISGGHAMRVAPSSPTDSAPSVVCNEPKKPLQPPFPDGFRQVLLGMGCFWGAERQFWKLEGVYTTAVGYAGGSTENPTYEDVCTGRTGHAEVVLVVYDPALVTLESLLRVFYESHDPTQGMR